jgi:YidC/Oxa1 family membrane protein insertase
VIELFNSFRDALYNVLKVFQDFAEPLLGTQSYWFSIVLLTIAVRILLIPLTVKQVRSTRVMQELAPEIKKLQNKHKNDRQKLNEEMMALYKERGFNPMAGCWPLLAQMPFFFALYQVIYARRVAGEPNVLLGKTFFGVPLEQHWWALDGWDKLFSAAGLTILLLTTIMSVTTYITQRQLMSRQAAQVNPQQQMIMRIMPLMFFVFAVNVPLAVIIYWVTTNFWSVGQQYIMLRTAPQPAGAAGEVAPAGAAALTDGGERRGLGPLSLFRGLSQSRSSQEPAPAGNKNGSPTTGAGDAKAPPKQAGQASKAAQPRAGQGSRQGGSGTRQGGSARQGGGGNRQQGSGGTRRSGSRSSGKGKSSGPRRGKR